ncbi:uncharacterized protein F4822DRAFT_445931 [Hypoxylon trugodes]|uniref:uncharacterized protein n=1 Tax=Hypoxylon trugodes TaxID=326681 RepID=UPI0021937973|nr:uncharacterized protein F4822DRAFT_445931 [Hypoxylon trugodes]KAI1384558.1 hypothetical protein F4822DRAFT_445931 [Hypoxylon trugodes]
MPGSSTRDTSPNSSSSVGRKIRNKRNKKLTEGDAPGSKKKDKNVKDSGGVVAAVTRHGAKFTNGNNAKDESLRLDSPLVQSPDLKPATPASIPTNGNVAISPLLDAVSTTSVSASTAPSAHEWARLMGPLAGSPSNLISIMGDSPPTQPSSYEDQRSIPYTWNPQRQHFANNNAYSASPPNSIRRPLSFQLDAHYPTNDIRSQASSPPGVRRSSMHSPFPAPRVGSHPPLPHQPQAHFYGAPDIDFDLNPKTGLKPGERGFYFGFDILPSPEGAQASGSDNVVLAGYEGGIDIYGVGKHAVEPLASLKGLRGGVYDAKILPWNGAPDPYGIFPLIALVIHGPVVPQSGPEIAVDPHSDGSPSPRLDGIRTPQSDSNQRQVNVGKALPIIDAYQTTVEVYSLATNKLVDVLLQAPKTPIKTLVTNPIFRSPPPAGAFQIRADAGSIVVSSGLTGECWIYRQVDLDQDAAGHQFYCVGKLWTSLNGDSNVEKERSSSPLPTGKRPQMPIVSLSGRWLAYCPPASSHQKSLNPFIPVPLEGKAPGLSTLAPPILPNESSDVDQPMPDHMMNRFMRETTQDFLQGARWVTKQSAQIWKNYWSKPGQQTQSRPHQMGSPPWNGAYPGRSDGSQFPPTYGIPGQPVTKEPGLVSILDLHGLSNSSTIHHVTTFKAPLGCSFLSFSPTGLSLFTASSKGDVQTVWDLMRIQYTKSSALQNSQPNNGHATRVRQVAQFSRMTVARIVDVSWARPNGERVAMVTERGTVHLLDMPPSAYAWPPPRRRVRVEDGSPKSSENAQSAVSMASNALSSAYDVTRTLTSRQRRSSSNSQTTPTIMDHASYGGKVLAAGISHSLGNAGTAINHLRHTGENRVSLPPGNMLPGPFCATWLTGKKYHTLFVLGDGLVRTFPDKSRKPATGKDRLRSHRNNRYRDFKLKNLPDDLIAPFIKQIIDPIEDLEAINQDHSGGTTLIFNPREQPIDSDYSPEASIPQAEIESSAPYQPFHTDRRVGLYIYDDESTKDLVHSVSRLLGASTLGDQPTYSERHQAKASSDEPWAFGQAINGVMVNTGLANLIDEDIVSSVDDHRALPASAMERVLQVGENDEQIVVTTRRRRGGNRSPEADEDGFFEDDCEVLDFADQRV